MQIKKSLLGIALGLGLALSLLGWLGIESPSRAAPSAELHVCPSGCAYASVQEAVDAADPGDVIKVAQGSYTDIHVRDGITQQSFVEMRTGRDATLSMPRLMLPSVQVNMRAGQLPPPESNGVRYLKLPLDV